VARVYSAVCPVALTPGTRLGTYDILGLLGEGGMGLVYRARDSKLNRDVAIKVLSDSLVADADRIARFRRSPRTMAPRLDSSRTAPSSACLRAAALRR